MVMPLGPVEQAREALAPSPLVLALISGGLLTPPALAGPGIWGWGVTVIVVVVLLRPRRRSRWAHKFRASWSTTFHRWSAMTAQRLHRRTITGARLLPA
ncbi:hypothetical protein ACFW5D_30740 [Streptomyces sp. NPDC058770]|uniref:hypothetical protein n=1 Tax=Streptomyces sp. NPDC058770 TaxID=3346631 RepID=UPI00368CE192